VLGRLPGVERPAIVTSFPTKTGECALLDMGANVDPKPATMAQWAVLGACTRACCTASRGRAWAFCRTAPRSTRGRRSRARRISWRATCRLTAPTACSPVRCRGSATRRRDGDFEYVGYVEGRDVFRGDVDVVVTDGFTGNVVLKSVEGAAEVIMTMVREEIERAGRWPAWARR
jgi:glycerol-3-phosphate acyltransferase PlsX